MHELFALYSSWSPVFHAWARTAVGIVLWFWVISGAIFALRFLAFVLLDGNKHSSPLAASAVQPYPIDHFETNSSQSSRQD